MVDSKDELFCRLAIRLGLLTREDAVQIIKSYRSDAGVGQGVGNFVVEEGWLEPDAVQQIEDAIAARAPGHVSTTRRRVPKTGKGKGGKKGGKHPVVHHHHVNAYPDKVNATGLQVAMIGVGAVILLGSVIFLIFQFQESDSVSPEEKIRQEVKARKERTEEQIQKAREQAATPTKATAKVEKAEPTKLSDLPPEERANLENSVNDHIFTSRGWDDLEPYRAVKFIQKKREELKDIPKELLEKFDDRLSDLELIIKDTYESRFVTQLRRAKANGDEDEIKGIIADIADACGPEYRTLAEKEIE